MAVKVDPVVDWAAAVTLVAAGPVEGTAVILWALLQKMSQLEAGPQALLSAA